MSMARPGAIADARFSRKAFWIGVLYFAQGFPLGVFYEILPVHFRSEGVNLGDIGFLSLLGLGWSIKYLWAPVVGHVRAYRRWMFIVDLGMAALISPLIINAGFHPGIWLLIGAFVLLSATNDIAIDAYTIEMVGKRELGLANGLRIAFYRAGLLLTGALLILEQYFGWNGVYAAVAVVLVMAGIACRLAPPEVVLPRATTLPLHQELSAILRTPPALASVLGLLLVTLWMVNRPTGFADGIAGFWWYTIASAGLLWLVLTQLGRHQAKGDEPTPDVSEGLMFGAIVDMLRRPGMLPVLLFAIIFKLADTTIGFMVKPFWLDAGFSPAQIGIVSVNIGIALTVVGGILGGIITDRVGIFNGLWMLGLTQVVSNLGYAAVAWLLPLSPESAPGLGAQAIMYSASAIESFTQGLGTGAFLAFLMAIVDKRRSAAEYALLSSLFTFGRSVAGWAGGMMAEALGYFDFFLLTSLLGLPAYLLLPWVRRMLAYAQAQQAGQEDASPGPASTTAADGSAPDTPAVDTAAPSTSRSP
jgi:PAT family beta-lactamase induction signal transducer AmpG